MNTAKNWFVLSMRAKANRSRLHTDTSGGKPNPAVLLNFRFKSWKCQKVLVYRAVRRKQLPCKKIHWASG